MRKNILFIIIFSTTCFAILYLVLRNKETYKLNDDFINITEPAITKDEVLEKIYPIHEFKERINKKTFGTYVTPDNSPIKEERFKGFHTGVDVEYEDINDEVFVFGVCDGEIVLSRWINGYGGTVILKCDQNYYLYGHLNIDSVVKKKKIFKGEKIGSLGKGNSKETDFERKHLHFSINKKSADLRGYVQNKEELNNWINPIEYNF